MVIKWQFWSNYVYLFYALFTTFNCRALYASFMLSRSRTKTIRSDEGLITNFACERERDRVV